VIGAFLLAAPVLAACGGSVPVVPPDPDTAARSLCADLTEQLPDTVVGEDARATDPDSPLTAAWGDPAIVLRCGVPDPAALEPTSQLLTVNDVNWFPEELTAGYLFTTYGRTVNVEVTVPDDYAPEAGPLTDLADAVHRTVPRTID
jgi:hypothetical protein